jgi:glyoxylase-like metal-dependent hydrolase (beta-lactamase superfamily II)
MLIHPRCPCSRASLAGLEKILTVCRSYLVAHVFFLEPKVPTTAWGDTELRRRAAAIPMTRSIPDPGGVEARRFGAMTSGHVLVYDRSGKLLFSGGIAGARGQEGDNTGSDAASELSQGK